MLFPHFTHDPFLSGIVVAPISLTLVFNSEIAPISEFADEVRIEAVSRGLEPESMSGLALRVTHPIFHFGELIDELGTSFFFAVHASDLGVIMLLEYVPALVEALVNIVFRIGEG